LEDIAIGKGLSSVAYAKLGVKIEAIDIVLCGLFSKLISLEFRNFVTG
jgi:hypothetical protein